MADLKNFKWKPKEIYGKAKEDKVLTKIAHDEEFLEEMRKLSQKLNQEQCIARSVLGPQIVGAEVRFS